MILRLIIIIKNNNKNKNNNNNNMKKKISNCMISHNRIVRIINKVKYFGRNYEI